MSMLSELIAAKLNGGGGGGTITVDDAMSSSSENPVQNKIITAALNGKADTTALSDYEQKPTVVTDLSSTSITLEAAANTVYNYGTLTALTVSSFPAQGKFWIWFTSGSTATTTVGISNFVAEANKVYKITVENGFATYDSWATT